jgi:hypothetical protein
MWVLQALLECKVPQVIMAQQAQLDHKDRKDPRDIKVPQVKLVPLG